ncbi:MAG TPA: NAD(P)/FAD-dependent oxidoreductase [Herpetosiphonaceae bacterium]|nr:NAD(P)/FAD-dependent oxidoreductase [Herpetosiphonaceae bacterium]
MYDLVIVGGGPAALSAAFYAQNKRLDVMMVYEELGGKTNWNRGLNAATPRNGLPGNEMVDMLVLRTARKGRVIHDRVVSVQRRDDRFALATAQGAAVETRAVLVATGATPRRLEVPGVQHLLKQGLGYSLTTFAHQVEGCRVAVIGATPRSLRGVAEIMHSAQHLYVISAEPELPDLPFGEALRRAPNLEVLTGTAIRDVIGLDSAKSVVVECDGTIRHLPADRIFVDLGLIPNTGFLQALDVLDPDGFVVVDEVNATAVPGLYAAGDVTTGAFGEQVLIAIGDGARAAVSAYEYLLAGQLGALAPAQA